MSEETPANPRIGRRVIIVLSIAIGLDTLSQLLWKLAATRLPTTLTPDALLHSIVRDPLPLLVIGVLILQLINWLVVLERVDLSYAQPLTALSYVSVCLLATWVFGERLDLHKGLGVSLVLVGVVLVGIEPTRPEAQ